MQDLLTEEAHQEVHTKRAYTLPRTMLLLPAAWEAMADEEQAIAEHFDDEAEYYAYKDGLIDWNGRVIATVTCVIAPSA